MEISFTENSLEIYKLYLPISPSQQCHYKTRISQSWNAWLSAGCSVEGNSWFALVSLHCRRPKLTSGGTYAPRGIKPGRTAGWLRTNANQLQYLFFLTLGNLTSKHFLFLFFSRPPHPGFLPLILPQQYEGEAWLERDERAFTHAHVE